MSLTPAQWRNLPNQAAREDAWLRIHGYDFKERYFGYQPITTPEAALQIFVDLLFVHNKAVRARARRAYLAAYKGGRCQIQLLAAMRPRLHIDWACRERIRDYRFLRLWEFNHIEPRNLEDGQFVISGNDCAKRRWATVRQHALDDTVLLCRECHWRVTEIEKEVQIATNRALYGTAD